MKLEPNHEIIGTISNVHDENGWIKLTFSVKKEIDIPIDVALEEKLKALVGHRVGILNLDGNYKVRRLK